MDHQENQKELVWESIGWCEAADAALHDLIDPVVKPLLIADIAAGDATLFRISGTGFETYLLTRMDCFTDGTSELVLEAIRGQRVREILEQVKIGAKINGVESIRFSTPHSDKVAARLIGCCGFERVETLYRVTL